MSQSLCLTSYATEADSRVLRERYVRDDIPCGYEKCHLCTTFPGFKPVLPTIGFQGHTKYAAKEGHWLVIDTNIVLHQVSCETTAAS